MKAQVWGQLCGVIHALEFPLQGAGLQQRLRFGLACPTPWLVSLTPTPESNPHKPLEGETLFQTLLGNLT